MKCLSIFILFALTSIVSLAQVQYVSREPKAPYIENLTDGMIERKCSSVIEDKDGLIWIGTANGVSRYDGQTYTHMAAATNGNNNIFCLYEDTISNCIWATTFSHCRLLRIDKRTYEVQSINYFDEDTPDNNKPLIISMASCNDSLLIVSTRMGIKFYNKKTNTLFGDTTVSGARPMLIHNNIYYNKSMGAWYVANNGVFCRITIDNDAKLVVDKIDIPKQFGSVRHASALNDSLFVLEVSPLTGKKVLNILSYDIRNNNFESIVEYHSVSSTNDMVCVEDGVWMSSTRGLSFLRLSDRKMYNYSTRNSMLISNGLSCMCKLRNQPIIFVGSSDGLMLINYYSSNVNILDMRRYSESSSCEVFMVHKDIDGGLWTWMIDGMYYCPRGNHRFDKAELQFDDYGKMRGIFSCVEDTAQRMLYFAVFDEVHSYSLDRKEKHRVVKSDEGIVDMAIYGDKLIGLSKNKIFFYGLSDKNVEFADLEESCRVSSCCFDGDSLLWFGTGDSRVYSYNVLTRQLKRQTILAEKKQSILGIRAIVRNGQREVWMSSGVSGLYYYLPDKRHLVHIEYSKYLKGRTVNIEVDDTKNVWVSTDDGVVCVNNQDGNVYEYSRDLFPVAVNFHHMATCKGYDGELYFGGSNCILEFHSNYFSKDRHYPAPVVSSYRYINSQTDRYDSLTASELYNVNDTIYISEGIRSVQLSVRIANYDNNKANLFQWRMPQLKDEWVTQKTSEPLMLTYLPRGVTELQLRSCDKQGLPTNNVRSVFLDNDVFYYEHPAFHTAVALAILLLVIGIIVMRSSEAEQQRKRLEREVEAQAGQIRQANEVLRHSQLMIEKQNAELIEHRNTLETQVAERTADLEEARAKAEESSKLKSAFLANLSHEVRTPMNCIVGFSKLLADPSCSEDERKEFVHLIQESSSSLLVLIGDLLDVSRIESGQLRVNRNTFEVSKEIYDIYRILSVEKKHADVEFHLVASESVSGCIINSDKERFKQIIINLVYNAFKFTEHGHVSIYADVIEVGRLKSYYYPDYLPMPWDVVNGLLLIRIEDTGIGIPADKMTVIFEPFRKLNNNKTLYPGLGLGLNIVKNLIRILDGQIWLTSIEGHGTTFYFYLPV